MAEIRKLKDGELTVYPQTVGTAVILEDGTTVQDLADDFADFDPNVLKTAPSIKKVLFYTDYDSDEYYDEYQVYHPYMDKPGAEIVLLGYQKKNGKKKNAGGGDYYWDHKKGWCVVNAKESNLYGPYFVFHKHTSVDELTNWIDYNQILYSRGRHFGIALRIPNPEWTRPATKHKNAIYKGIPESLWSDVLSINIHSASRNFAGLGILR